MKILIDDISGYKSIIISNYIKKCYRNSHIIGVDTREFTKFIHTNSIDKFIYISNSENYVEEIKKIIKYENINLFIPTHSGNMGSLIEHKKAFNNSLSYYGSKTTFDLLNNKYMLAQLCKTIGIKMPSIYDDFIEEKLPLVVKPRISASSLGVEYIFTRQELQKAQKKYTNRDNVIIQGFIKGEAVGYSVFCKNGKVIVGYGHRRLVETPVSGGSSVYRETFNDVKMIKITENILSFTNWSGFAMFEFKRTNSNEFYLIEVNPRIWGSINQGLTNGINYFSYLLGESNKYITKNKNYKTYLSPLIYKSLIEYCFTQNYKPLLYFIKNIIHNKADVNIFSDLGGYIGLVLRNINK